MSSSTKRHRTVPLQLVLTMPFLLLAISAMALVGYLSYRNGQRAVDTVANSLRNEINARIDQHLLSFLSIPHQLNKLNTTALRRGALDATGQEALGRHFLDQIRAFDSVTSIYFGNEAGGLIDAGREGADGALYIIATENFSKGAFLKYKTNADGDEGQELAMVPDFDARTRGWYRQAVEKGEPTWNQPYILFTGQDMAISASSPAYDREHNLLGVVAVDIFLSHLSNFLASLDTSKEGQSFIMERSGRLIATSTGETPFIKDDKNGTTHRLSVTESANETTKAAGQTMQEIYGNAPAVVDRRHFEFSVNGIRQLAQISPIGNTSGLDWLVVTIIPEKLFMAQIAAGNQTTIKLMIGTFFIVAFVGLILAYWVTAPISRLSDAAQNLAHGKWNQSIPQTSKLSELSTLTTLFNDMAEQLREKVDGLNREIVQKERIKSKLKEQEINFRTFFNTIDEMLFVVNEKNKIIWYNRSVDRKLGYSEDELIGKSVLTIHPPEWRDEARRTTSAMLHGDINSCPVPVMAKDGRYLPAETLMHKGSWSGQQVLFGVTKDLSTLKASEEKFARAFQTSPTLMAIITFDTGIFVDVNNAFLRTLGYRRDEVIDKTARQLRLFTDEEQPLKVQQALKEKGWVRNLELEVQTKSGEIRHGIFAAEYLVLQEQDHILGIMQDITPRKQLEKQLIHQQSLAAVGQLSAGIAHHFNNILTGILGYTELTMDSDQASPGLQQNLTKIHTLSLKASILVRQLLDYSQKSFQHTEPVTLTAVIQQTINLLRPIIPATIQLSRNIAPGQYELAADADQLKQLLTNLLKNAARAMEDGGKVDISLCRVELPETSVCSICLQSLAGSWIELSVTDEGAGMDENVLPHIFEPFFTTAMVGAGSGLGLSQAAGIAHQHGGHITVESKVGSGTTIHVLLPDNRQEGDAPQQRET